MATNTSGLPQGTAAGSGMFQATVTAVPGTKIPAPVGRRARFLRSAGRPFTRAAGFIESKNGVYAVVAAILLLTVVVTILFSDGTIPLKFVPLYEADAEMLIVAAAVLVVALELAVRGH